jgi:hypothetical protein
VTISEEISDKTLDGVKKTLERCVDRWIKARPKLRLVVEELKSQLSFSVSGILSLLVYPALGSDSSEEG